MALGCQHYHHHHLSAHRAIIWPPLWPEKCLHVGSRVILSVNAGPVYATPALLNRLIKRYRVMFVCAYVRCSGGGKGVASRSYPCRMLLWVSVALSLGGSRERERENIPSIVLLIFSRKLCCFDAQSGKLKINRSDNDDNSNDDIKCRGANDISRIR